MDYLNSYTATLLEQSRFYFPPLAAVRTALQETRPPLVVAGDSPAAPPSVQGLTPFMELGLLHAAGTGALPRERGEIPLDLSMKTIRQTPDSTADDDVILLEQRRNSVRTHALQMAAAAAAAGKLPFSFGTATPGSAQGSRLTSDHYLHQSIFGHDSMLPPTPVTSAASMVTSPAYRCPQPSDGSGAGGTTSGGTGSGAGLATSAFLTPQSSIHAAVCGGLNGFCLDPHRCRLAAAIAAGASSSASRPQHPSGTAAGFPASSAPFSTLTLPSAAAVAAAAMYERHLVKLSGSAGAAGMLQGLSDLRLPGPPTSSSSGTTPTSTSSSTDALKHHFTTGGAAADRYLSSFVVPSAILGLPLYQHHHHSAVGAAGHHHSHHSKDVSSSSCTCCLPKPYPIPCLCCYPSAVPAPPRGYDGAQGGSLFSCCPPTPVPPVTSLTSINNSDSKDKVKREGGGHHHHHHHHHSSSASASSSHHGGSKGATKENSSHDVVNTVTSKTSSSGNCGGKSAAVSSSVVGGSNSAFGGLNSTAPQRSLASVTKEEPSHCRVPSAALTSSPSPHHHRSPTPPTSKPQPEGGRWVPRPHSHKDKVTSAGGGVSVVTTTPSSGGCGKTPSTGGSNKSNKVFAPVVRIRSPSSPSASKVVTPVSLSSSSTTPSLSETPWMESSVAAAPSPKVMRTIATPTSLLPHETTASLASDGEPPSASLPPPTLSPHGPDGRTATDGSVPQLTGGQELDSGDVAETAGPPDGQSRTHQDASPSRTSPLPVASSKAEGDGVIIRPTAVLLPPAAATIERWMLSPPSVKTSPPSSSIKMELSSSSAKMEPLMPSIEMEGSGSENNVAVREQPRTFAWSPFDVHQHHQLQRSQLQHSKNGGIAVTSSSPQPSSIVPARIWSTSGSMEDGGSASSVVAPVAQKPANSGSDLPASPPEGSSPTSLDTKTVSDRVVVGVASETAAVAVPFGCSKAGDPSSTSTGPLVGPSSLGGRESPSAVAIPLTPQAPVAAGTTTTAAASAPPPPSVTAKTMTPVIVSSGCLYRDENVWKTPPLKRCASGDLLATSLQHVAKKKKKDVIVISMRDEQHHLVMPQKGVPPLQSVKRKLNDDLGRPHHVMSQADERLSSIPSIGATPVALPRGVVGSQQQQNPFLTSVLDHQQQPLLNQFFSYKSCESSIGLGGVQNVVNHSSSEPPPPKRHSLPSSPLTAFKDVSGGCGSSCPPTPSSPYDAKPISRVGTVLVHEDDVTGDQKSPTSAEDGDGTSETRLPPVGVTLVKTTTSGVSQYKSSVLNGTVRVNGSLSTTTPPSSTSSESVSFAPEDATAAMLRRYYEQQKLRLQQYGNNSSSGYATPPSTPADGAKAPVSSGPSYSFPVSTSLSSSFKSAFEEVWQQKRRQQLAASSSPFSNLVPPIVPKVERDVTSESSAESGRKATDLSAEPQSKAEAARDDSLVAWRHSGPNVVKVEKVDDESISGSSSAQDDDDDDDDEEEEEEDEDEDEEEEDDDEDTGYSPGRGSPAVSTTPTDTRTPSPAPTSSTATRAESTRRLVINKALGETTLHRAARLGYMDALKGCLNDHGSSSVDVRDNARYTPLHECCSRGHLEIARLLLQHGADPNASAAGGIRPIHDAVENDQVEIVRLLLSYGADPMIATYSGLTPLKIARSSVMTHFLKGYLADLSGEYEDSTLPWQFHGLARFFDPWPTGFDPLSEVPSEDEEELPSPVDMEDDHVDDDVDSAAALVFEDP